MDKDLTLKTELAAKDESQTVEEVNFVHTHAHTHTHTHTHMISAQCSCHRTTIHIISMYHCDV